MLHHDATSADIVSDGPFADVVKNLAPAGRGERLIPNATTDVWALDGFAYVGTFNAPCGDGTGDNGSGIRIFDVENPNMVPDEVGVVPSVVGSRTNDVKVANLNSGRILVHSNESCGGGPGGFEIYNVDDPTSPVHLKHVQTDDVNGLLRDPPFLFLDFGVHNLFLFTQGDQDYAAAVVGSEFGNFQIFNITDPASPWLVGFWGAESLLFPSVDFATTTDFGGVTQKIAVARFTRRSPALGGELRAREGSAADRLHSRHRNRGPAHADHSEMSSQRVTRSRPDSFEA